MAAKPGEFLKLVVISSNIFCINFFLLLLTPVIEFQEMESYTGKVIQTKYYSRRNLYEIVIQNEKSETQFETKLFEGQINQLMNQKVTVWYQKKYGGLLYIYNYIHQVKIGDVYLNDYDAIKLRRLGTRKFDKVMFFIFLCLAIYSNIKYWRFKSKNKVNKLKGS